MTVVLLHPIGLDGDCWQFLSEPRLRAAVRYTLPWHGDRPQPLGEFTLKSVAEDVATSITGPLDIVGVSMGGYVARRLALDWPHRVRSLLTAGASAGEGDNPRLLDRADQSENVGMPAMVDATLARWFTTAALEHDHPGVAYARERLLADDAASFAASWRALAADDSLRELPRLTLPTTIVHATQDDSVPLEVSQDVAAHIPGARLVAISAPHMMHLEQPRLFESAVLEHLDRVDARTKKGT